MNLQNELKNREEEFNSYWWKYLQGGTPDQLYDAARHLPMGGGKRLRPFLVMLSCKIVSGAYKKTLPFGAALELMHNFTLVHDDIMDKSSLRRNVEAVHIKYGEPAAILAGDLLFAQSFEAMHDLSVDCETFKQLDNLLIKCVLNICEGQQLDVEFEKRKIISEEEYIDMITRKTAVFFRLAAKGGAIIGGGSKDEISALTEYGMNLGLSFQIWDDYLDMSSDEEILGKNIGNDIRNGKKTLIAVNSLHNVTGTDKQVLDEVFGNCNASDHDVKRVFTLFKKLGSIDYAKKKAIEYNKKAKNALANLIDSEVKELLYDLADYSISREN
jgi:geranylgeranyl diphosphate synthase type I